MSTKLIPERLKNARENIGITKAEASRRLNLSKIGYCRYEYGERTPSPQTVEIIAQCLHTSVDYLVGKSDNPEPSQLVINKELNPDLYALVELCQSQDSEQIRRLISYCKKE
ncbi:MAG: helix-turn-helix transcriptional regulator [Lachnospiraceae bacterium]|nr:helix-turn-helix transcriptional regulator [Lachnospiraceae bacterium]